MPSQITATVKSSCLSWKEDFVVEAANEPTISRARMESDFQPFSSTGAAFTGKFINEYTITYDPDVDPRSKQATATFVGVEYVSGVLKADGQEEKKLGFVMKVMKGRYQGGSVAIESALIPASVRGDDTTTNITSLAKAGEDGMTFTFSYA